MDLNTLVYLAISILIVITVSISGVFFIQKNLKKFLDKNLHYLISFSAGVFCLLSYEMFHEAEHILDNFKYAILSFATGFFGIFIITKILPQIHEHHDSCCDHSHKNKIEAKKILIGDAFHNVGDGIILTTAFLTSLPLGLAVSLSVIIHEFLQEISEFFVLKEAGFSTKKALVYNFLVSLTIIIGVIIALLFSNLNSINGIIIGITSGIFFNTVIVDLIPHGFKKKKHSDSKLIHISLLFFGILFMFLILHSLEHSH
ncbi:MAG: ZIP family metal transporter [Candidatus Moranbacteria bacterium]|nr:ZIP family metal transporter [Candidatus Moranbacteria bacterium]